MQVRCLMGINVILSGNQEKVSDPVGLYDSVLFR